LARRSRKRDKKTHRNALEAAVLLRCDRSIIAESRRRIGGIFHLSDLTIEDSVETEAVISNIVSKVRPLLAAPAERQCECRASRTL
jgi:hypothetical protein